MAIALVGHTKLVGAGGGAVSAPISTPAINTTGANFIILFYTFYNGGDYPAISDSKGNTYYAFQRQNAFSPALASELRYTKQVVVGAGHTWTVQQSGLYPSPVFGFSLYVAAFSGVQAGADSNPNFFSAPWYNDGGDEKPPPYDFGTTLGANPGSAGGTNGQLILMGWGNSDDTFATVLSTVDGLGGTPSMAIIDSDLANLPLPSIINYNAGLAYYVQPTATGINITQTWVDHADLYPHDASQAVMSGVVIEPAGSPAPPVPGVGNRSCGGEMGPVRVYTPVAFAAQGVLFDGFEIISTPALSNADSSNFAFFCWFNVNSVGVQTIWKINPDVFDTYLEIHPSGGTTQIFVGLSDSAGTKTFVASASPVLTRDTNWHSLLMSGDMNHAAGLKKFKMFVDGVDVTHVNSDTSPAFAVAMNGLRMTIGQDVIGNLSEFWMANLNLIDGSGTIPPATLAKFVVNGKAQSPDGFPFPATLLFNGDANSFANNTGTAGQFFLSGSLTNSGTNPP